MRRLIVNADDLGYTPGVSAGIFEAHAQGLVTSTTLMVGRPAAEEAARDLERFPDLGVGLHVTLTGGGPTVAPPGAVPSLLDAEGRLARYPEVFFPTAEPEEVLIEVRAQLDRFRRLTGRQPTHLDSHHHSHRLPVVLEALVAVALDAGLPVRSSSPQVGERLRQAGVPTTDAFVESFFGEGATLENLVAILDGLGPGVTELMCHPAHIDEALRRSSSYVDDRARELEVLTSAPAEEKVRKLDLSLGHFGSISP